MTSSTSALAPTSTSSDADKLSGQLIIKAQLDDDIRKMMIHNEDLTLNELVLMMERVFAGKISNSDEITIKYQDDDGDKITLLNDSDLNVALHFHKVLRLFILVNGSERPAATSKENVNKDGSLIDAKAFRSELQQIRNSVQAILDRLQLPKENDIKVNQDKEITSTTTSSIAPPTSLIPGATREFDPLKHLQQTQRASTPDSVRSRSSIHRKFANHDQKSVPTTPTVPPADNQFLQPASDSSNTNKMAPNPFQQSPIPTQNFVPTTFADQQTKTATSPFGPPPTVFSNMPPLPNVGAHQFSGAFPPTLPNTNAPPAFNPGLAGTTAPPPTGSAPPTGTFIGQQPQQQAPPPHQYGFYAQQQAIMQQRSGTSAFAATSNTNTLGQGPPPSSSSPATINPSFVQTTAMPAPPPLASQQPYLGYQAPSNFYNPAQQYPKTS